MKKQNKNILVAPLNWGLGHATRCIPIIKALENNGFNPIIASDGASLEILKKEFPHLLALELPSYNIKYTKKASHFKWKLIKNSPKMIQAIWTEKKMVKKWIAEYNLIGIISDNRFGVYSKKIPSVYITHQINVLSGITTGLTTKIHQFFISKYKECWIPDFQKAANITGKLGHDTNTSLNLKYIGILSRFQKQDLPLKYDLMIILSGPEPQRTLLEEKLTSELKNYKKSVIFIKGKVEATQKTEQVNNITFYNFMQTEELEKAFNQSEVVLCRSGYSTIMDLIKLDKKAFLIPTPGQYEQEYLAQNLKQKGFFPYSSQDDFKIENLMQTDLYQATAFSNFNPINWEQLFLAFGNS